MWAQHAQQEQNQDTPQLGRPRAVDGHRVAVLLNANARKVSVQVVRALRRLLPPGDLFLSRHELDARRIAQSVVERGYHTVFLGGGDGTVMCFVNEILDQVAARRRYVPVDAPRFAVLKLGTGNSVGSLVSASPHRDGGFLEDVRRVQAQRVPSYRAIDLLRVEGKRAPFAGLGADGKLLNDYNWVKENLAQGPLARVMTGPGGYFASVAFRTVPYFLTHSAATECEVVNGASPAWRMGADGREVETFAPGAILYRGPLMMAAAGTVPFYGYELKMFPFAGKRRGHMDLRLGLLPPSTVLANLPRLWAGRWFPDGLKDFLVKDVEIRFSQPMPFQVAGDAAGARTSVRFEVAPEPIQVADFNEAIH